MKTYIKSVIVYESTAQMCDVFRHYKPNTTNYVLDLYDIGFYVGGLVKHNGLYGYGHQAVTIAPLRCFKRHTALIDLIAEVVLPLHSTNYCRINDKLQSHIPNVQQDMCYGLETDNLTIYGKVVGCKYTKTAQIITTVVYSVNYYKR